MGLPNFEDRLQETVRHVWRNEVRVKSDYARQNAEYIAAAASAQLITTKVSKGIFSGGWEVTQLGLKYLNEVDE
jgi:hypothetical protein